MKASRAKMWCFDIISEKIIFNAKATSALFYGRNCPLASGQRKLLAWFNDSYEYEHLVNRCCFQSLVYKMQAKIMSQWCHCWTFFTITYYAEQYENKNQMTLTSSRGNRNSATLHHHSASPPVLSSLTSTILADRLVLVHKSLIPTPKSWSGSYRFPFAFQKCSNCLKSVLSLTTLLCITRSYKVEGGTEEPRASRCD